MTAFNNLVLRSLRAKQLTPAVYLTINQQSDSYFSKILCKEIFLAFDFSLNQYEQCLYIDLPNFLSQNNLSLTLKQASQLKSLRRKYLLYTVNSALLLNSGRCLLAALDVVNVFKQIMKRHDLWRFWLRDWLGELFNFHAAPKKARRQLLQCEKSIVQEMLLLFSASLRRLSLVTEGKSEVEKQFKRYQHWQAHCTTMFHELAKAVKRFPSLAAEWSEIEQEIKDYGFDLRSAKPKPWFTGIGYRIANELKDWQAFLTQKEKHAASILSSYQTAMNQSATWLQQLSPRWQKQTQHAVLAWQHKIYLTQQQTLKKSCREYLLQSLTIKPAATDFYTFLPSTIVADFTKISDGLRMPDLIALPQWLAAWQRLSRYLGDSAPNLANLVKRYITPKVAAIGKNHPAFNLVYRYDRKQAYTIMSPDENDCVAHLADTKPWLYESDNAEDYLAFVLNVENLTCQAGRVALHQLMRNISGALLLHDQQHYPAYQRLIQLMIKLRLLAPESKICPFITAFQTYPMLGSFLQSLLQQLENADFTVATSECFTLIRACCDLLLWLGTHNHDPLGKQATMALNQLAFTILLQIEDKLESIDDNWLSLISQVTESPLFDGELKQRFGGEVQGVLEGRVLTTQAINSLKN